MVLAAATKEGEANLFVINADGSGRRLLRATSAVEAPAGWSHGGTKILFTQFYPAGGSDVFVMDVDGTHVRRLTRSPARDGERTGHPQVFVMNAGGSRQRNISRSRFNDEATSWR